MKIGILEAGSPPSRLEPEYGRFDGMISGMLGDGHSYRTYRVFDNALPADPRDHDAYVISGSIAGVHDGLPWVETLVDFLRLARGQAKLVGLCFGHQVMAHAFGGAVVKAPQGWGLGLHTYRVAAQEPWMDGATSLAVPAFHQDQVTTLPQGARVVAESAFTPLAMLAYGDASALSFQGHPEFTPAFTQALIDSRVTISFPEDLKKAALRSLYNPGDNARAAGWIRGFLAA